jgi:hypothetical protein
MKVTKQERWYLIGSIIVIAGVLLYLLYLSTGFRFLVIPPQLSEDDIIIKQFEYDKIGNSALQFKPIIIESTRKETLIVKHDIDGGVSATQYVNLGDNILSPSSLPSYVSPLTSHTLRICWSTSHNNYELLNPLCKQKVLEKPKIELEAITIPEFTFSKSSYFGIENQYKYLQLKNNGNLDIEFFAEQINVPEIGGAVWIEGSIGFVPRGATTQITVQASAPIHIAPLGTYTANLKLGVYNYEPNPTLVYQKTIPITIHIVE